MTFPISALDSFDSQIFKSYVTCWPSNCFTSELAEQTLKDLLRASQDSALYQLTDYHWLLLYEVLERFTEVFNDEPDIVTGGSRLVSKYKIRKIDFHEFIDHYFWDMDFLTNPDYMINLGQKDREGMGFNKEAYGVIQRWPPHPEELELIKVNSAENTSGK